jgi:hypothetical protein
MRDMLHISCKMQPKSSRYATSSLVAVKFNIVTVLLMQASISHWMCIRCDWWFIDKSTRVILHICCQMQPNSSRYGYVNTGASQIQYSYSSSFAGFNIQLNVSPIRFVVYRQIDACYTPYLLPITGKRYPVYAMSTLVPFKANAVIVLAIQASIFSWTYLHCNRWFIDNSTRVIIHVCCQIEGTIYGLRYVKSGTGKNQSNYSCSYSGCNIPLT